MNAHADNRYSTDDPHVLISGYLDGELTQQEAQKVSLLIESNSDYQKIHQEMSYIKSEIQSLSLQQSEVEHLNKLFQQPTIKYSKMIGVTLLAVSFLLFITFTLYFVLIQVGISLWLKIAIALMGIGCILLFFSVLKHRIMNSKTDKFSRVQI